MRCISYLPRPLTGTTLRWLPSHGFQFYLFWLTFAQIIIHFYKLSPDNFKKKKKNFAHVSVNCPPQSVFGMLIFPGFGFQLTRFFLPQMTLGGLTNSSALCFSHGSLFHLGLGTKISFLSPPPPPSKWLVIFHRGWHLSFVTLGVKSVRRKANKAASYSASSIFFKNLFLFLLPSS